MVQAQKASGQANMETTDVGEIIHLFEVMKKYSATCSLELQTVANADPLFTLSGMTVNNVEYIERLGGPDAVLFELGEMEFGFDLGSHVFAKQVASNQIFISVHAEGSYSAWFSSGSILPEGISEAMNYEPPSDGIYPEDEVNQPLKAETYARFLVEHDLENDFSDWMRRGYEQDK